MRVKGYKGRDPVSHRKYSWRVSLKRFSRTGKFAHRGNGSGHRAGEAWGAKKGIDPDSMVRRYSKNSPSFDEGVYQYKEARRKALKNKMK